MEVIPRYGVPADVAWKMGRIMLRFRPIAPKPVSGGLPAAAGTSDPRPTVGKRKRAEGKRGRKSLKRAFTTAEAGAFREESLNPGKEFDTEAGAFREEGSIAKELFCSEAGAFRGENSGPNLPELVTLPLMPETPSPTTSGGHVGICGSPTWRQQKVGSWVAVDCVTDTWRPPFAGPPPPSVLEADACPCFVSDAAGEMVTWTNAAHRMMAAGSTEVVLAAKGMVPAEAACFTCRVRVRYTCSSRGREVSMAAPCDVWRLGDGRLVWRLDVKAALSLSLGC